MINKFLERFFVITSRFQFPIFWIYTLSLMCISILSRLLFNGDIFDFDYHLYQPDGAIYTYQSLKWLGHDHYSAANEVINWYDEHAEDESALSIDFFDPSSNPGVWSLAKYRVLYPLLSIPFVYFFGVPGMLVVPVISFLVMLIVIALISVQQRNLFVGAVIITLLTLSPTLTRWHVANITDGLLAALFSLILVLRLDKVTLENTVALISLILLTSATRFCTPYWYAIAIFLFLKKNKRLAFLTFFLSTLSTIPTLVAKPDPGSIVSGVEGGFLQKALYLPVSALRVLFIEIAQLAALDRALLLILMLAVALIFARPSSDSSLLFLFFVLAGWFIGSLNGVLGVNFRYQLPIIPIACNLILTLIQTSTNRLVGNIVEIKIRKRD